MLIRLLSCKATRPDRRARSKLIEDYAGQSTGDATEQIGFLLDGSEIEVDVFDAHLSSAYRAVRKHDIDYEIIA